MREAETLAAAFAPPPSSSPPPPLVLNAFIGFS